MLQASKQLWRQPLSLSAAGCDEGVGGGRCHCGAVCSTLVVVTFWSYTAEASYAHVICCCSLVMVAFSLITNVFLLFFMPYIFQSRLLAAKWAAAKMKLRKCHMQADFGWKK